MHLQSADTSSAQEMCRCQNSGSSSPLSNGDTVAKVPCVGTIGSIGCGEGKLSCRLLELHFQGLDLKYRTGRVLTDCRSSATYREGRRACISDTRGNAYATKQSSQVAEQESLLMPS